jgi:hypothetical protein
MFVLKQAQDQRRRREQIEANKQLREQQMMQKQLDDERIAREKALEREAKK